jgi:hypothetical protein
MLTTVIKVQQAPAGWQDNPQYVYIGRFNAYYGLPQSKWHNPFKLGPKRTREDVLKTYIKYIMGSHLRKDVGELKGKTLVCWCTPLACHGDVLAALADSEG